MNESAVLEQLLQLRHHYQTLLEQHQSETNRLREQLNHVNALLLDHLPLTPSIAALTPLPTAEVKLPQLSPGEESISPPISDIPLPAATEPEPAPQSKPKVKQSGGKKPTPGKGKTAPATVASETKQSLTDQVKALLELNVGSVLSIREVVQELNTNSAQQVGLSSIRDLLSRGARIGYWDKIPNKKGLYTFKLVKLPGAELPKPEEAGSTIESDLLSPPALAKSKPSAKAKKGKAPQRKLAKGVQPLPAYARLPQVEAVEKVVQKHKGKAVTSSLVVSEIFGALDPKEHSKQCSRWVKALWAGAKQGRWQQVPNQKGSYTLDTALLES